MAATEKKKRHTMRIAIVEDEEKDMAQLRVAIEIYMAEHEFNVAIDTFSSGTDFLRDFSPKKYELIFFDNYIGDALGIDFARKARSLDEAVEFVFVSMSPEFAISSYDVRALHYILKPVTPDSIDQVFDRFQKHARKPETPLIEVMKNYHPVLIPIQSIRYFEVTHRTCLIHADEDVSVFMSLDDLMERLPPEEFIRTHKSYAVRLDAIKEMGNNEFILKCGATVPIGRTYQNVGKIAFLKYLVDKQGKNDD
ncbi:MAG: response regulator transcription factor [Schwartzia sp.]|nr:response regulator transcription factor [Schwartzia sp. (in: firmicutes)]